MAKLQTHHLYISTKHQVFCLHHLRSSPLDRPWIYWRKTGLFESSLPSREFEDGGLLWKQNCFSWGSFQLIPSDPLWVAEGPMFCRVPFYRLPLLHCVECWCIAVSHWGSPTGYLMVNYPAFRVLARNRWCPWRMMVFFHQRIKVVIDKEWNSFCQNPQEDTIVLSWCPVY